ncbi:hypothetical protein [Amycolatopsis alkalitolerans]|uniref:Uncharacterized protein n=1 Tax=Amycolatopsis alkalitolerans TaxID=2547244 RepID=A0A5C4M2X5_9PSEU|nr:hypothetical protein [Amycolatopsis alkalitolerans]TNC24202.1 hypothetical protein FG385_19310 [Amycolatopsis alkalitolerans]
MAVPRYGVRIGPRPGGAVAPAPDLDAQITELRVHGVGGTAPDALLRDLAPEQVGGDRVAGFYRTADLEPAGGEPPRHVEGYAWGGITSRSSVRVLWLLLVPFMLANLAGWMYRGEPSGFRFAWHRVAANLACLALTVNAVLVAVMIGPDLITYQATRAGLAHGRWWLWPLSWTWVGGGGQQPLVIGYATVVLGIAFLVLLAVRTQSRYEAVEPPWRLKTERTATRKSATDTNLADRQFWNSAIAVRRMTGAHIGAAFGFLALVFAVTSRAAAVPAPRETAWWWAAVLAGGLALAVSTVVVAADRWLGSVRKPKVFGTPPVRIAVHAVAPLAVVCAAVFALRQPEMSRAPGSLPGLDTISAATFLGLGGTIVLLVLIGLAGRPRGGPGPVVVMLLAAGLLNSLLLGLLFAAGHALGRLGAEPTTDPAVLAVPVPVAWAGPLLTAGLAAALLCWAVTQAVRWSLARDPRDFGEDLRDYRSTAPDGTHGPDGDWYVATVAPEDEPGDPRVDRDFLDAPAVRRAWQRGLERLYRLGEARSAAPELLWLIAAFQVGGAAWAVFARPPVPDAWFSPNGALGKVITFAGGATVLGLMWLLRQGWRDPARRKQIGVLWDVGTFWPRSYHPLAPPCYAERAVPDVQRRIWRLNDHGAPVLLVGHSQGSVLSTAALLPADCRAARGEIALVTFGNPTTWLYEWAFPAWVNPDVLAQVLAHQERARVTEWRNFSYPTDPIGNSVRVTGNAVCDERLRDPAFAWHIYGDPPPPSGGHSGYWTDSRVWDQIGKIAQRLQAR